MTGRALFLLSLLAAAAPGLAAAAESEECAKLRAALEAQGVSPESALRIRGCPTEPPLEPPPPETPETPETPPGSGPKPREASSGASSAAAWTPRTPPRPIASRCVQAAAADIGEHAERSVFRDAPYAEARVVGGRTILIAGAFDENAVDLTLIRDRVNAVGQRIRVHLDACPALKIDLHVYVDAQKVSRRGLKDATGRNIETAEELSYSRAFSVKRLIDRHLPSESTFLDPRNDTLPPLTASQRVRVVSRGKLGAGCDQNDCATLKLDNRIEIHFLE